jgi:hypothetical protein
MQQSKDASIRPLTGNCVAGPAGRNARTATAATASNAKTTAPRTPERQALRRAGAGLFRAAGPVATGAAGPAGAASIRFSRHRTAL